MTSVFSPKRKNRRKCTQKRTAIPNNSLANIIKQGPNKSERLYFPLSFMQYWVWNFQFSRPGKMPIYLAKSIFIAFKHG